MGARQATAVPIPATLNVVSGGATDHDLLAGRATREASGLRAELPGEGSVPTKRAALVNGWGKVALHGRAAVAEIVGILVVRLPAKRKHVVLPHRNVGGRTLAVRLKDLRRVNVAKGAWGRAEGRHGFGSGSGGGEHVVAAIRAAIHELLLGLIHGLRGSLTEALRSLLSHVCRAEVEAIVVGHGYRGRNSRLVGGARGRVKLGGIER